VCRAPATTRCGIRLQSPVKTQAPALTLVTNAGVVWNTVYVSALLDQLRAEGMEVREEDVRHPWPARHEHINPHGKYGFNWERDLNYIGLWPLRHPGRQAGRITRRPEGSANPERCFLSNGGRMPNMRMYTEGGSDPGPYHRPEPRFWYSIC
jgi:Tn3 transposase DDE domain